VAVSFDTIPHSQMIQCVARRISDREMLALIKRFLKAPVQDQNDCGPSGGRQAREEGTHRVPHSTVTRQFVFPAVHPGLEETGLDGVLSGAHRQLRGRFCDLL
jgi:hypothetical protein